MQTPFGLIGRKLGHSWSRQIHEELGSAPYSLLELEPEDVAGFVREGAWRGINVTIPYKADAAAAADERSPRVERLGVANTLVRRPDGAIYAENTDVLGFAWMLERFCRRELGGSANEALLDKKCLVLGSGGASQAVQAALEDAGAAVVVVSRSGEDNYGNLLERHADASLVVNTTPVGMFPSCPDTPVAAKDLGRMEGLLGVLDVVYNPNRTGICLAAESLGLPSESGLAMLVAQAFFASELFQGRKLDEASIEPIELDIERQTRNIVLIGMPGAGKTTTGKRLARLLGRPFVDIDDEIGAALRTDRRADHRAAGRGRVPKGRDRGHRRCLLAKRPCGRVRRRRRHALLQPRPFAPERRRRHGRPAAERALEQGAPGVCGQGDRAARGRAHGRLPLVVGHTDRVHGHSRGRRKGYPQQSGVLAKEERRAET